MNKKNYDLFTYKRKHASSRKQLFVQKLNVLEDTRSQWCMDVGIQRLRETARS